jgi:hypothetical protein
VIERLCAHVAALCAPAMAGRAAGSAEGAAARAWIVEQLAAAGARPLASGWLQPLPSGGANVIAEVPGGRGERTLLIGAHYDHLGRQGGEVYWGADDNASAVAILIELARALAGAQLDRRVILVAFDAEEPPHFLGEGMGSEQLAQAPPIPLASIDLMVAMDLVGHALGPPGAPAQLAETLLVVGAERSEGTAAWLDALPSVPGIAPRRLGANLIPPLSDYHPFAERGVPFLFLTGGRWRHYHTADDTPEKLDYAKLAATAAWLVELVRAACAREGPTRFRSDGRDDRATARTLRELAELGAGVRPHLAEVARRAAALERVIDPARPLAPAQFTELFTLAALVESALA